MRLRDLPRLPTGMLALYLAEADPDAGDHLDDRIQWGRS